MRIGFFAVLLCCVMMVVGEEKKTLTINLGHQHQEKMKLFIGLINPSSCLDAIAENVTKDLACVQQKLTGFIVTVERFEKIPSKQFLKILADRGYPLVILLRMGASGATLEWGLYDTLYGVRIYEKRMTLQNNLTWDAHRLADRLWVALTGQEGSFSTTIAYCKQIHRDNHRGTDIIMRGFGDDTEKRLVQGGKLLALRWNKSAHNPLLLYSEVTPSNVRLMSVTLQGVRHVAANLEGLTMLPSFSVDGKQVIYCGSSKGMSQLYACSIDQAGMRTVKKITENTGNNTSPTLCSNGDVIFCSDFETRLPQIYYLHVATGQLECLTSGGYCASPHFSEKNGNIAYCKLVDGVVQLFVYDIAMKRHNQLTRDKGNKDECCWSPCGNYLLFCLHDGISSRLSVINMISHEQIFLTDPDQHCSYPSWSPHIYCCA